MLIGVTKRIFFFFGVASKGLLEEETFKLRSVFKKKKKRVAKAMAEYSVHREGPLYKRLKGASNPGIP